MIKQFKQECKNYNKYLYQLQQLKMDYNKLEYNSFGVHSPSLSYHSHSNDFENTTRWINKKEDVQFKINTIQKKINYLEDCFEKLEESGDAYLLWQLLVLGYPYTKMAKELNMNTNSLHRRVAKDLQILTKKEDSTLSSKM